MKTFRVKINYRGKLFGTYDIDEPNGLALDAAAEAIYKIESEHPDKDISEFTVHSAKPMKPQKFWFHYNKPESRKLGKNVLTIHFNNVCHFVTGLICNVPIATHNRKAQPRCVMTGSANNIIINDGVAVIS